MDVILLEKIKHLGGLGDQVHVKAGYGRNYLIPQGKAIPATEANVAAFEARREELEQAQRDALGHAQARAEKLGSLEIVMPRKVGVEGKLFGSVNTIDIVEAVQAEGVELAKQEVRLPEGPIRLIGDYEVNIHLHADVDTKIKLQIIPE